jgi:hypothetical protein
VTPILTLALSLLVTLGPEQPLGNTASRPAVFNQWLRSVASNGRDFVALWSDERGAPFPSSRPALYTARIGGEQHQIADSTMGGTLFWNGSAYQLLYMLDNGHTLLQTLDDDGKPVGVAKEVDLAVAPREAATNGRNLLTLQYNGSIWLNSLDGPVLWKQLIGEPADASPIAVLPNGDYRFAALTNKTVLLVTVDGTTGFITEQRALAANVDRMGASIRPDGRALVAWTQGATAQYELVDVTQPATFATNANSAAVAVGWDGHQFGVVLDGSRLFRVSANGQLLDAAPLDLAGEPAQDIHFATSANGVLIAGDAFNAANVDWDVLARAARSFDDAAAAPPVPIATSLELQQRPRVADGGLTLWVERDLLAQLPGSGAPHTLAAGQQHAGIGRGASSYLVAWIDAEKVLAKRVAFDGTPIDADAITLADAPGTFLGNGDATPAIAFDGRNYLVVWGNVFDVFAVRVGQDGRPIDAQPIALTSFGQANVYPATVRAAWSGTRYIVAFVQQTVSFILISPRPPAPVRVGIVTVAPSGQVLDAKPRFVFDKLGTISGLGLAASGQGLALVWSHECVYELALHNDGTPDGAAHTLACGSVSGADVAWDGSEFASVWTEDGVVKGQRLDVDDAPFDVTPPSARASQPSIGASAGGATIAYVRDADGVPRVFTRTLLRSGTPPRHRPSR